MNYFRSFVIFFMGVFTGSNMFAATMRGYPTTLEIIGFVLFPIVATIYARLTYNGQ